MNYEYENNTYDDNYYPLEHIEEHYISVAKEFQVTPDSLLRLFFSNENICRIQKKIKKEIYLLTNKKVKLKENQSIYDLLIIMKKVYKFYDKNLYNNIIKNVKFFNKKTIKHITPGMLGNIKQYYGYISHISNPIQIMDDPINVNSAGRLQLPGFSKVNGF